MASRSDAAVDVTTATALLPSSSLASAAFNGINSQTRQPWDNGLKRVSPFFSLFFFLFPFVLLLGFDAMVMTLLSMIKRYPMSYLLC